MINSKSTTAVLAALALLCLTVAAFNHSLTTGLVTCAAMLWVLAIASARRHD